MPTIYLIRHGEADHNIAAKIHGDAAYDMPEYWNPSLTELGLEQASRLQTMIELHDKSIIVSPLQRALETAAEGFPGTTFQIDDRVAEFNPLWRCNRRVDFATLRDEWPVPHILNCSRETPCDEETREQLQLRARSFIESIEEDTVVVTHHDFIRACFEILNYQYSKINHCYPYCIEIMR